VLVEETSQVAEPDGTGAWHQAAHFDQMLIEFLELGSDPNRRARRRSRATFATFEHAKKMTERRSNICSRAFAAPCATTVRQVLVKKSVDGAFADSFVTGASSGKPVSEMRNASDVAPDRSCGVPP
jgi:hypothetical protein